MKRREVVTLSSDLRLPHLGSPTVTRSWYVVGSMEYLFAYGTLQSQSVQISTFGRKLEGTADALPGYKIITITIDDQDFVTTSGTAHHRNLQDTGDSSDIVEGTVFKMSAEELERADSYEPESYARALVHLRSGIKAWVYLTRQQG